MSWQEIPQYLKQFYQPEEYPCLIHQYQEWDRLKPLKGVRIFDGSPLFRNSLAKYLPLLAGGADLTIGVNHLISWDHETATRLQTWGVRVVEDELEGGDYDFVLDCAGVHSRKPARLGYVELTRSGVEYYADQSKPVFLADDSRIKLIEDTLGTGDGYMRAMQQLGYTDFNDRKVVVFGCGKVGRGICLRLHKAGAQVVAIDNPELHKKNYPFPIIHYANQQQVKEQLAQAWCVVTVTGKKHALADYDPQVFLNSGAILTNMGVENEYGPGVSPADVLHENKSLNFMLEEPTLMKYIDATLALHNEAVVWMLNHENPTGLFATPAPLDEKFLSITKEKGIIQEDLELLDFIAD